MKKPRGTFLLLVCCLTILLGATITAVRAMAPQESPHDQALSLFMQAKLDHSKDVLEGITTADFSKIIQGAQSLRQLTENELWRVSPDITYERYAEEFLRLTVSLEAHGRAENVEGATLDYVNLTINCVNCHKFVRDQKITAIDLERLLR